MLLNRYSLLCGFLALHAGLLGARQPLPLSLLTLSPSPYTYVQEVTQPSPPNLLANSNFEVGNVGFASSYAFTTTASTLPGQEGCYTVTTNPQQMNGLGASFGDHTTGAGQMLIVNGSTTSESIVVWQQSVPVKPRTIYRFSFWVASWGRLANSKNASSPAQLEASINGERLGTSPIINAPPVVGQWKYVSCLWLSGPLTKARLTIIDRNNELVGNDFALDDLAFQNMDYPRYSDFSIR